MLISLIIIRKKYDLNSNLEFEGEYLCGKRWNGIVIHRHKNKKILFEGEYKNGKRSGMGKEYFRYCKLKYSGEYLDGKYNGKGIEYFLNGKIKFEGEFLNGKIIKKPKKRKSIFE